MDIGAEFTRLYSLVGGKTEVFVEEPTILLYNEFGELKAFGADAKEFLGKTPPYFYFQRPVDESGIHQFEHANVFFERFLKKNAVLKGWGKPSVCFNSPLGSTPVQVQAGIELLQDLGFAQVYTLPTPVGAALGTDLDLRDRRGNLIVIFGASHTEIAVVSLFKIVSGKHLQIGLRNIYQRLVFFLRESFALEISERMAEELVAEYLVLSEEVGVSSDVPSVNSAPARAGSGAHPAGISTPLHSEKEFFAVGIDLTTHLPKKVKLKSAALFAIAQPFLNKIILALQEVFETVGPEIVKDILERGVIFTGGGAYLKGLTGYFEKKTTMRLLIPENPSQCIARGNWTYLNALARKELPENLFPKERGGIAP